MSLDYPGMRWVIMVYKAIVGFESEELSADAGLFASPPFMQASTFTKKGKILMLIY